MSNTSAVVQIEGLIPAGATKGTPFDVLVTALPGTTTRSLEGGRLPTWDLSVGGANPSLAFRKPLATVRGPTFVDPVPDRGQPQDPRWEGYARQAVVLSGGTVIEPRPLELVLNQPSWQRSRLIADRINEKFHRPGASRFDDTAVAKTDALIRLTIPPRYQRNPQHFLSLISHLYVQRAMNFEVQQAQRLADLLVEQPDQGPRIALAWEALGSTILPVIRPYYGHESRVVQMTALAAGARLDDAQTLDVLEELAVHPDAELRQQIATGLVHLREHGKASRILRRLLDDPEADVRVAAYESLAAMADPYFLQRQRFGDEFGTKFILDLVPSRFPMVYIKQVGQPRIVIFNPETSFSLPLFARIDEGRLMIRGTAPDALVEVYYQKADDEPGHRHRIAPTVANLVFLLGHETTPEHPTPGMDLSFSQVVGAVYRLWDQGAVEADLRVQPNPLAEAVDRYRQAATAPSRPEVSPDRPPASGTDGQDEAPTAPPASTGDERRSRPETAP
jgi:hypothetical protein